MLWFERVAKLPYAHTHHTHTYLESWTPYCWSDDAICHLCVDISDINMQNTHREALVRQMQ